MSWNRKYWDTLDQLYWTPAYLGLRSLTPEVDPERPDHYLIPRAAIPKNNSIYTRRVRSGDFGSHLNTKEEILNQVLNIALAIAPDDLIARLIARPLDISDSGPYESIGRELIRRFKLSEQVFQQDGFFVSPKSALALEIKLKSPSSPEQLVKYVSMLALEEIASGTKEHLGLLYVVPEGDEGKVWKSCGLDGPRITAKVIDKVRARRKSAALDRLLDKHEDRVRSVLSRIAVAAVSWRWFRDQIRAVEKTLDETDPAQQCYRRLLAGLRAQIEAHKNVGLEKA